MVFNEVSFGEIERDGNFRGETAAPLLSRIPAEIHESLGAVFGEEAAPIAGHNRGRGSFS
jgi:hypothetical protein